VRPLRLLLLALAAAPAAACGNDTTDPLPDADTDGAAEDAPTDVDALDIDAPELDGGPLPDAANAVPLPGFGDIAGMCGVIDEPVLTADQAIWFQGELTFADRYDDPAERDQLTAGGRHIVETPNAGGSSLYSEVFAFEWLARCELATLLKTETEIVYDVDGKKADLLVELDGRKIGVSVVRAVTFPFGQPYTMSAATTIVTRKIEDLRLATSQVSAADLWTEQMVAMLAYDAQHAQVAMDAWNALSAETRGETMMVVAITSGDDLFIYTDN
jgi:hypothetical protein